MAFQLVDAGEEYLMKNGFGGASIDTGLYNDSTDAIAETDADPSTAITTEPSGANYARQSSTPSASDEAGDWGISYSVSFTTDDSSSTVDGVFALINFNSTDSAINGDNIVYTAGLSQSRDLSQIDQLDVTVTVTVT